MGNELLAIYIIFGEEYKVYGCWDNDTPENEFDFYDINDKDSTINIGEPFFDFPTWEEVKEYVEENILIN